MVRPVSFKGFQKGFHLGVSDFPLGIMCLYQIPQLRGKLHYVFDTDSGGVTGGLVFRAKRARSSLLVKSGIYPAVFCL